MTTPSPGPAGMEGVIRRTPYDGRPYYCADCGCGLAEWMACESDCSLETAEDAKARATLQEKPE